MSTTEPRTEEITRAAQLLGRRGGTVSNEKKTAAVRRNAQKGGRPRGSKNRPKPAG